MKKKLTNITHILNDATFGSAIAYWANIKSFTRDDAGNVKSFIVQDGGPDGEPVKKGQMTISAKKLLLARDKLVNGDVSISRSIAAQFVGKLDEWEYDSWGVDALVQTAFFGELVYG